MKKILIVVALILLASVAAIYWSSKKESNKQNTPEINKVVDVPDSHQPDNLIPDTELGEDEYIEAENTASIGDSSFNVQVNNQSAISEEEQIQTTENEKTDENDGVVHLPSVPLN